MTIKSFKVSPISSTEIDASNEVIYVGWTATEINNFKSSYQAAFFGCSEDFLLEITCNNDQSYYVVFRSGESFKQQRQFLLIDNTCFVIVNSNGNLYRFDAAARESLDIDCYANIQFNSPYLTSNISQEAGIMTVVDDEGLTVLNWDGVLWKKDFEYARADNLQVTEITQHYISLTYQSPSDGTRIIKLDTFQN